MSQGYQVIARRWRPKNFDQIVGQEHIVRTLKNALKTGRIAHAYLFVGPRGTGKTTTARILAKALNAEGGPSPEPADDSAIGQEIMEGRCLDVQEIDGASNNSVEQIRELRENCVYQPSVGTFRIYIIDEVHMLTTAAFNALLKTLEEPPPHVKFIFATTEAHKVLPTITSRCQRFEFRPIDDAKIVGKLQEICSAEGVEVTEEALAAIARLASGGMRDSQTILDQMISFCGSSINAADVQNVYGLVAPSTIEQLTTYIVNDQPVELLKTAEELEAAGRDLFRVLRDLQDFMRTLMMDAVRTKKSIRLGERELRPGNLIRMMDALLQGEEGVKFGLARRVNFEVCLLRALDEGRQRDLDEVLDLLSDVDSSQKKK